MLQLQPLNLLHSSTSSSCVTIQLWPGCWLLGVLVVCVVVLSLFFQFGSGSFHFETEGVPPLTWRGKSLQSFVQEVVEEGGWAPFMPNITILIALMLFLVWRGRVVGNHRAREAQSALNATGFNHCFFLAAKCDLYFSSAHT